MIMTAAVVLLRVAEVGMIMSAAVEFAGWMTWSHLRNHCWKISIVFVKILKRNDIYLNFK